MTAGARLEAAYRAQLVALGVPVETSCSVCGGRLHWMPAGLVEELADPFTVGEVLLDVMHKGGDRTSPVSVCRSCWTLAVWCFGTHGADDVAPRVSLHFVPPVSLQKGAGHRKAGAKQESREAPARPASTASPSRGVTL